MKINVKTLKGEIIELQLQNNDNIERVKQKIKQVKGFEIDAQKIVYKGKPMNNKTQLQQIGIKQGQFMVLMNVIKKPENIKKQQTVDVEKNVKSQKLKQISKPKIQNKQKIQKQLPNQQAKITQLVNMGFSRQNCVNALKAADQDSQKAVQFLINGIPSNIQQKKQLSNLFNDPQFSQIRQQIKNNPGSLQTILQTLSEQSPQLYRLLQDNPDQLQDLLYGQQDEDYDDQGEQMNQIQIQLNNTDQQAINRLMGLGFSKLDATQVFMACDKNQELAANMLFDRLANGDLDQQQDIQEDDNDPFYQ